MTNLRSKVIRLAHQKPELQPYLLPLLKEAKQEKSAGWWSLDPLGGDTPLDLIHEIEELPVAAATAKVKSLLSPSKQWQDNYVAMGIWDLVVSKDVPEYSKAFQALTSLVKSTAELCYEEWSGDGKGRAKREGWTEGDDLGPRKFLVSWMAGKPSGKYNRSKLFVPTSLASWYIKRAQVSGDMLFVEVQNFFTKEKKSFDLPLEVEGLVMPSFSVEVYGGLSSGTVDKQQSVLVTAEGERDDEDVSLQVQLEIDSLTGEFKDDGFGDWE